MRCPHCTVTVHQGFQRENLGQFVDGYWVAERMKCPSCGRMILFIVRGKSWAGGSQIISDSQERLLAYPRGSARPPVPPEVDDAALAADYSEACQVLPISPKAAAALGRRCLQHILRERAGVKRGDLRSEIQEVLDRHLVPTHLAEAIDAVRNIGNFAAHPIKSTGSGEIVPVEAGEAEWTLDVVEGLFDFFFVQPSVLKAKRAALDAKLKEAGKPPVT
jgi:hypothetical protein